MSRIARLLSYHSFGAKNSLERQKTPLKQACKYSVFVAFQLLLVSHLDRDNIVIKLTSSSSILKQQIIIISRIPNPKSKSTLSLVTAQRNNAFFFSLQILDDLMEIDRVTSHF